MQVNALIMDASDNVVTCVKDVAAGESIVFLRDSEVCQLTAESNIPYCHKAALTTIEKGGTVVKYGEAIGEVSERIEAGQWIAHHNLFSIPRDYDSEMLPVSRN